MSEDQLRAITQKAYDTMKAQEQAAEVNKVAATGIVPDKMVKDLVKTNGATLNVNTNPTEKQINIPSGVTVNVVDQAAASADSNTTEAAKE